MPVSGTVRTRGATVPVEGLAWMDREWSTSALGPDQVGWDWFALQLDDGRELMLYRLRQRDGGIAPESGGTLIAADGTTRTLDRDASQVFVMDQWTSPRGGTRYPARWRIRVPSARLEVVVTPLLGDQELDLAIRYWEGAVRVEGTADGRAVGGSGYVELVGYAGAPGGFAEAVRQ
jgi:predicted secreted hydrolase